MEVAEKCKQLRLKEFSESSVDDVGYGTDNELNNISNLITSGVKFPEETIFSKEECLAENCMCSQQNDKDPDFFRMDNLVQFKIPVKPVNVLKINGDTPKQHGYVGRILCKDLLGIIPGHFKSSKTSSNQRLRIRGLDPTRDILKKKHVQNGDCLRLVNGQEVTWNNIDEVFTRLCSLTEASIVVQQVSKKSSKSHHQVEVVSQTITKDSGIVQLLPKKEQTTQKQQWADNSHVLMYLDLEKLNSEENNKNEDVLFQFPENSDGLVRMRGAFVTLYGTLKEISSSAIKSSTFMYNNNVMNAAYHREDNNILILILPHDRVHPLILPTVLQNLVRVLRVQYNSLHESLSCVDNHHSVTALLSSVIHQLYSSPSTIDIDQCGSCRHTVQYLPLDSVFSDNIDRIVTEWESSDYKEMSDSYYGCRRTYTVLGSCLFYKSSIVCNHLPQDDLLDVYLYLKYQHILSVCSRETVQTTVIWREIFPTRQFYNLLEEEPFGYTEPVSARWVWLIVAYKHTILCTMLETNGYHTKSDVSLAPDSFLIDQAKATMMQIVNLNMYKQMDHCSRQNTSSLVTSLPESPQNTTSMAYEVLKNSGFNKYRKSNRFHRDSSIRSSASSDSGSSVESGKKPLIYFHGVEGNNYLYDLNHGLDIPRIDIKLSVGATNCMLHYLHVDKHEGVYIKSDNGEINYRVLHNFSLACSRIKDVFDKYRFKRKSSDQDSQQSHMLPVKQDPTFRNIREEGVLFQILSQDTQEKSSISYWVIGRQRSLTETYVCFRDETPQSTVELAFKIAFGIKPG